MRSVSELISRREFGFMLSSGVLCARAQETAEVKTRSRVSLVKGTDRKTTLAAALDQFGRPDFDGRDIYLKASYASPGAFPATTHPETLSTVVELLRRCNCGRITLVERSGMGDTRDVWKRLGVDVLARQLDLNLLALEELAAPDQWRVAEISGWHWSKGVYVPRFLDENARVVQICNVKTHRFGGVFSASLKNSVGLIGKRNHDSPPHNYMQELHASPHQCLMIAEINQLYEPALLVMDAAQTIVSGGPEGGDLAAPGLFAVATDRVALDAVAVAILRIHGAEQPIRRTDIFDHAQILRAVELKLGAGSPDELALLAQDSESRNAALQIQAVMSAIPPEEK
jgi:uncharacterized protein (DUF362 family)